MPKKIPPARTREEAIEHLRKREPIFTPDPKNEQLSVTGESQESIDERRRAWRLALKRERRRPRDD